MKVDLDDIERKSRAEQHGSLCADPPCCCCAPLTLALIARIRELEATVTSAAGQLVLIEGSGDTGALREIAAVLRAELSKGVVLP